MITKTIINTFYNTDELEDILLKMLIILRKELQPYNSSILYYYRSMRVTKQLNIKKVHLKEDSYIFF